MNKVEKISIVIPVYNEEGNLKILVNEIINAIGNLYDYEILFVDDKSTDDSKKILDHLEKNKNINVVNNKKNMGQSYSIYQGILRSNYENIVTLEKYKLSFKRYQINI